MNGSFTIWVIGPISLMDIATIPPPQIPVIRTSCVTSYACRLAPWLSMTAGFIHRDELHELAKTHRLGTLNLTFILQCSTLSPALTEVIVHFKLRRAATVTIITKTVLLQHVISADSFALSAHASHRARISACKCNMYAAFSIKELLVHSPACNRT